MGTWGIGTFENDGTLDWLWDLEESDDASLLKRALEPEETEYLDAGDGEIIIASAEIIHAIKHGPRAGLPENALAWIDDHRRLDVSPLVGKAVSMLDRVVAEHSELRELWEENDENYPQWLADVTALRDRLAGGRG